MDSFSVFVLSYVSQPLELVSYFTGKSDINLYLTLCQNTNRHSFPVYFFKQCNTSARIYRPCSPGESMEFILAWTKNSSRSHKRACVHKTTMEIVNLKAREKKFPFHKVVGVNIPEWAE